MYKVSLWKRTLGYGVCDKNVFFLKIAIGVPWFWKQFTGPCPDRQKETSLHSQQGNTWRYHAGSWFGCVYKIQEDTVIFVMDNFEDVDI